jgi:hypothetical protein
MRLNPDCIRDILFYVEENAGYSEMIPFYTNLERFNIKLKNDYPADVILYHLELCEEYGYLTIYSHTMGAINVKRLSVSGHEFLENIRQDTNWNKTKEVAKSAGSTSIEILSNVASNLITALISKKLGL